MATDATKILYGTDCYLTVAGTDIGHLIGETSIEMAAEIYYPKLARARGKVKGTGRVIGGVPKIKCTMAEFQYAVLSTLFSIGASSDANSEKIGYGAVGTVTEVANVVVTGARRNDGDEFRATLNYAYVTSPMAITLDPEKESSVEIEFEGLYTDAAPSTYPGFIEFKK